MEIITDQIENGLDIRRGGIFFFNWPITPIHWNEWDEPHLGEVFRGKP